MTMVEWLLLALVIIGGLNFLALLGVILFLWNIDSNSAEARGLMNLLPSHGSVVEAANQIERALRK